MEGIIGIVTVILILAYIGLAIWVICERESIGSSIGASLGFVCGGVVIIPIAEAIATFVCWAVVIGLALFIIGTVFGG